MWGSFFAAGLAFAQTTAQDFSIHSKAWREIWVSKSFAWCFPVTILLNWWLNRLTDNRLLAFYSRNGWAPVTIILVIVLGASYSRSSSGSLNTTGWPNKQVDSEPMQRWTSWLDTPDSVSRSCWWSCCCCHHPCDGTDFSCVCLYMCIEGILRVLLSLSTPIRVLQYDRYRCGTPAGATTIVFLFWTELK